MQLLEGPDKHILFLIPRTKHINYSQFVIIISITKYMHAILSILTEKLINLKKGGLLLMSYSKTREQFVIIDVLILLKQQILKVYYF